MQHLNTFTDNVKHIVSPSGGLLARSQKQNTSVVLSEHLKGPDVIEKRNKQKLCEVQPQCSSRLSCETVATLTSLDETSLTCDNQHFTPSETASDRNLTYL